MPYLMTSMKTQSYIEKHWPSKYKPITADAKMKLGSLPDLGQATFASEFLLALNADVTDAPLLDEVFLLQNLQK